LLLLALLGGGYCCIVSPLTVHHVYLHLLKFGPGVLVELGLDDAFHGENELDGVFVHLPATEDGGGRDDLVGQVSILVE
jgi:hypothetical protein